MRLMKLIEKQIKKSNQIVNMAYYGSIGAFVIIVVIKFWKILK